MILVAYLSGSLPFGWAAVKKIKGKDIRKIGSGSAGATNVGRELGYKWGIVIAACDVLKSFIPTLTAVLLWPDADWLHLLVIAACSLGHSKSIFLGFTGGKAVSTTAGGTLAITYHEPVVLVVIVVAIVVFAAAILISDRMSVGSLAGTAVGALIVAILLIMEILVPWYSVGLMVLVVYIWLAHAKNVYRLLNGTEPRLKLRT